MLSSMCRQLIYVLVTLELMLITQSQPLGHGDYYRCAQCISVKSPIACQHWAMCGTGEECYTREFVDHQGKQSFQLGCESVTHCNLFLSARFLIGKRDVYDFNNDRNVCYGCCADHDCNSNLCLSAVMNHVSNPRPSYTCPPTFEAFDGHCYYLAPWLLTWPLAQTDCKRRGADLVSINSKSEQEFLVEIILNLNSTLYPVAFWTGGFWTPETTQWNWLDRNPVNYTSWAKSYPVTVADTQHIAMLKDPNQLRTGGWSWGNVVYTTTYAFICERGML